MDCGEEAMWLSYKRPKLFGKKSRNEIDQCVQLRVNQFNGWSIPSLYGSGSS